MNPPASARAKPAGSPRRNQLGQAMGAKGIQTRRRLLEATETLLNTTPLRELRVAQIVRLANTSAATFYVYFNDVAEAVLALIGELTQSPPSLLAMVAEPWAGQRAVDRAHEFVALYLEHWQAHAPAFRIRNLASDEGDVRFSRLRINAVSPLVNAMAARIEQRQAAGGLPADLHPASMAGALLAMIERIAVAPLAGGLGVTRPRLFQVAAFFTILVLGEGWEPFVGVAPSAAVREPARSSQISAEAPSGPLRASKEKPTLLNLQGQAMGAKGVQTRQRLIEATATLLRTRSLLGLSVADITKQAQTSTSTFYLYFQDVPEAVLAVIGEVTQTTPELLALLSGDWEQASASERAYQFVVRYMEQWQVNRALFRARNLAADEGDERFIRARANSIHQLRELITRRVAERCAQGRLPPDLHPAAAAGGFLAMIERLSVTPNIRPLGPTTPQTVSRAAAYFLTVLMHGLSSSSERA